MNALRRWGVGVTHTWRQVRRRVVCAGSSAVITTSSSSLRCGTSAAGRACPRTSHRARQTRLTTSTTMRSATKADYLRAAAGIYEPPHNESLRDILCGVVLVGVLRMRGWLERSTRGSVDTGAWGTWPAHLQHVDERHEGGEVAGGGRGDVREAVVKRAQEAGRSVHRHRVHHRRHRLPRQHQLCRGGGGLHAGARRPAAQLLH
eukprot:4417444-Pyramimonas_sp.AAC.1